MSTSKLEAEYRRLMRWYPRQWRAANEDALVGAMLDQAEHEGRQHPTSAERLAVVRAGVAQWVRSEPSGTRLRLIPLGIGALVSASYAVFGIWAPATRWPGSVGPFENPSIFACVLLIAAFATALFKTGRLSNLLALAAAITEVVVGVLAMLHPVNSSSPWEGPSPSAVVLFAGLAILGGLGIRRLSTLVAGSLLMAAGIAAGYVAELVSAALNSFTTVATSVAVGAALAVLAAVAILVWNRRRYLRRAFRVGRAR